MAQKPYPRYFRHTEIIDSEDCLIIVFKNGRKAEVITYDGFRETATPFTIGLAESMVEHGYAQEISEEEAKNIQISTRQLINRWMGNI